MAAQHRPDDPEKPSDTEAGFNGRSLKMQKRLDGSSQVTFNLDVHATLLLEELFDSTVPDSASAPPNRSWRSAHVTVDANSKAVTERALGVIFITSNGDHVAVETNSTTLCCCVGITTDSSTTHPGTSAGTRPPERSRPTGTGQHENG